MKLKIFVQWSVLALAAVAMWHTTCTCLELVGRAAVAPYRGTSVEQFLPGPSQVVLKFFVHYSYSRWRLLVPDAFLLASCALGAYAEHRGIRIPKTLVLVAIVAIIMTVVHLCLGFLAAMHI